MFKKIFFVFAIFLFFSSFANALIVQDISQQIEESNNQIIQNNAQISANVSQLKDQLVEVQKSIDEMKVKQLTKDDVSIIRENVDLSMRVWQEQMLILILACMVFAFAIFLYGKSKRWF